MGKPRPLHSGGFYPNRFEEKIGYREVVELIGRHCSNAIGHELIFNLHATTDLLSVRHRMQRAAEMMQIIQEQIAFPSLSITDLRPSFKRIASERSYIAEDELFPLLKAIEQYLLIEKLLCQKKEDSTPRFPSLARIPIHIEGLGAIAHEIKDLLDRNGRIKDSATPTLLSIRKEQGSVRQQMSRQMHRLLEEAIKNGFVEAEAQPSLRDGRPVLPVTAAYKRSIPGIVHDESSTGKTLFIEPIEIVHSNNLLRELESKERREIQRILQELTDKIRPHSEGIEQMYLCMGRIDAVAAIAFFAIEERAVIPQIASRPTLHWLSAIHPLLRRTLAGEGKEVVPLDISLQYPHHRILLISGPNAGGKSVCLKTVGLLQYMLQCGIPIPVAPDSEAGVFKFIAIDIGDDQSIEDDLSTYSSHLKHMRHMAAASSASSLLLIDEFGGGTEPEMGGAIAEGLLKLFNDQRSWGVITTHYRNLKEFAETQSGIMNGAMLYDEENMTPLFKLSMGHPGSSFAIEIARKQGIPASVLNYASEKVGKALVRSEKYVQDIARYKQYWNEKKLIIEQRERNLQTTVETYENKLKDLRNKHNQILERAREEASQLVAQSRARIERTIKEIVESKAEKEATKFSRQELLQYAQEIEQQPRSNEQIEREIEKLKRRAQRKEEKKNHLPSPPSQISPQSIRQEIVEKKQPCIGDTVRIISKNIKGVLLELTNNEAVVALGGSLKITCKHPDIERISPTPTGSLAKSGPIPQSNNSVIDHIRARRSDFSQELDIRGMRAMEADQAVQLYIDDAISLGMGHVRILHGTGTGALKHSIRQLLATIPGIISFHDEDVRFGGAGITVVHLD